MVLEPDPTHADSSQRRHETERVEPDYVVEKKKNPRKPREAQETKADEAPEVIGKYELRGELGRGAMGIVYRAYDRVLKRTVALKMIIDPRRASGVLLRRFKTEASGLARLHDPRIITVYEVGEHQGKPYIVMELVDGPSFDKLLREGKVPVRTIVGIVREVALALKHAHENGIIHRDVKPENVLIDRAGNPHLMDFGIAIDESANDRFTMPGAILGTPSYMSPEQASGTGVLTASADIYALGAVLYHALVGKPPFSGTELHRIIYKVLTLEPKPPRSIDPKIHPDLETITLRCLMKEPERRYATASDVADELGRFLEGEPIVARPLGTIERAWRRARRNRAPAVAVLLGLLLAGTGGYFLMERHQRELDRAAERSRLEEQHRRDLERASEKLRLEQALALTNEARSLLAEKRFKRAIETATRAIELDPKEAEAWAIRAGARFTMSDRDGAIEDATRAIELDPKLSDAWAVRASAYQNKQQPQEAIADATRAIELDPKDGRAFNIRAAARFNAGDSAGAIADANHGVELSPNDPLGWMVRAEADCHEGDYDAALADSNRAIEVGPTEVHAWYSRGFARVKKGDCEGGIADATRALELSPGLVEAWMLRAVAHDQMGDDKGTIDDATKTIELAPGNAQAWIVRAHARLNTKDREGARHDLEKYLELEPHGGSADYARDELEKLGKSP